MRREVNKIKIAVIGENLVDIFKMNDKFEAHPGGSPLNIAVGLARLGANVSYITKFSNDFFGTMLKNVLKSEKIDISNCPVDDQLHTTLAFVFIGENKVPTFEVWNQCTADSSIIWNDLSKIELREFSAVHFGSILLATPAAEAVLEFVKRSKNVGNFISFDPNYRSKVALDEKAYVKNLLKGWELANVVKCSLEDAKAIFGVSNFEDAVKAIKEIKIPTVITMGEKGSYVVNNKLTHIPVYPTTVVDTTGCGDAFATGMIYALSKRAFSIENDELIEAAKVGSVTAAFAAQKIGAISSFAYVDSIEKILKGTS